jgi:hypothetical protein
MPIILNNTIFSNIIDTNEKLFSRIYSFGTDPLLPTAQTTDTKAIGFSSFLENGLLPIPGNGEIIITKPGWYQATFMLSNHDFDGDWIITLYKNNVAVPNASFTYQIAGKDAGGNIYADLIPVNLNDGDILSIYYRSTAIDALDWQSRPSVTAFFDVREI